MAFSIGAPLPHGIAMATLLFGSAFVLSVLMMLGQFALYQWFVRHGLAGRGVHPADDGSLFANGFSVDLFAYELAQVASGALMIVGSVLIFMSIA